MSDSSVGGQRFEETAWSVVLAAGDSSPRAREALAELCHVYWPPIYAYLRRHGYDRQDAQDFTQSFFQHILENETLRRASRERGRFRNFLLGALKFCLADEHMRRRAQKRGGDLKFISIDDLEAEELYHQRIGRDLSPDELLDARWAGVLLDRTIEALRREFVANGKAEMFETLSPFLDGEKASVPYETVAKRMGISLGSLKTLIHRLRRQFATTLRREIMNTVSAPHEIDGELRRLRTVFARAGERQAA
jgi:DNA-directed RNA polymerase specialized sigma24 family protein